MKRKRLTDFEKLAQNLVEGSLDRLLGDRVRLRDVVVHLARAVEDGQADGRAAARYRVYLHPAGVAAVRAAHTNLEAQLAGYVGEMAQEAGLVLSGAPVVMLREDATLQQRQVRVEAAHMAQRDDTTKAFRGRDRVSLDALSALDAFLIVEGKRHVPLDRPAISIGRDVDNDVIVDASVVSRRHAHIRWRYGRFVIYDLGSRGGLAVNGQPCRECVLHAGDLITLSGRVSLIYGEGLEDRDQLPPQARSDDEGHTQALPRRQETN